jgi:signal transduction histidine kinase/ActR/RegA family two-component response regulator
MVSLSHAGGADVGKVPLRSTLVLKIALTYLAFGIVILAAVGFLAYQSGRRALEESTVDGLTAEALEKEAELRNWIEQKRSDIRTLASSPYLSRELDSALTAAPGSPEDSQARERLVVLPKIWVETGRKFVSMSVLNGQTGKILASTTPSDVGKFNEDRPYFINGKQGEFVQNPFYAVPLRAPSIVFSAPVHTASGKMIGVLVGFGDMGEMQAIAARRSSGRTTSDNYIVNSAGLYVTQPHYISDPASLRFSAQSEFIDHCISGNSDVSLANDYRGIPVIAVYRWIPEHSFCLIAKIDQAEAFESIRVFRDRIVWIGIAALVLASVLAIGLARTITGPVRALQSTAMRIGRGEFDVRLPERRGDELGLLAREFNRMASLVGEKQSELKRGADELQRLNAGLEREISVRKEAEQKVRAQVERLDLLHQITRAIGERQDLGSIFQVVVRSVEEQLPVDFACLCQYDKVDQTLTVARVGVESGALAMDLAMPERARIDIDENGLSQCVRGQLVYEPRINEIDFPFPKRLARGGLGCMVAAPLQVESDVFGVLIVARMDSDGFSSGECEFLRQLSEHVALATHQAQLYGALNRAYDDLRQTQQAVMQQERLRTLGQMASGIAHDINNALTPASLYTETLLETEAGLSAEARGYLETVLRAVDDIGHTVARLREFYRQQDAQALQAPIALNVLLKQAVDLTRARWSDMAMQRGIVVRMQIEAVDDLPTVMGVESEIREALVNLILNAVDALPQGGVVTLRTRTRKEAREAGSGAVLVEVIDNGVGMDEDTRRRCLEPFFTTKGERGTGLGLAMVYGIIQRHNAEIEIESSLGSGTTIRLIFPVAAIPTSTESPRQTEARPVRRLKILLVDDDPVLLRTVSDTLEKEGHAVTAAPGGQAGLDAFRSALGKGDAFALVITDLGMPNVDGRKVASGIKDMSPSTPVILLTGWGQRLLADHDMPTHVDRILSKPPKLREIREALAQVVISSRSH